MITGLFALIFLAILIGVIVYLVAIKGGRSGQSGKAEVNAQRQTPKPSRGAGNGEN